MQLDKKYGNGRFFKMGYVFLNTLYYRDMRLRHIMPIMEDSDHMHLIGLQRQLARALSTTIGTSPGPEAAYGLISFMAGVTSALAILKSYFILVVGAFKS